MSLDSAAIAAPTLAADAGDWTDVCGLHEIWPDTGACALIQGEQVAVFRLRDGSLHAIDNHDPCSGANVLSRGIVGDLQQEKVVASPIYKQHFSLSSGRCLEDATKSVRVWPVRLRDGRIEVQAARRAAAPARRARPASTRRKRLVVIGNGMAAMRTLEGLHERAPELHEITVLGAEPHGNYNRILLSAVLAGERRSEDIITHPRQWYEARGIRLHAPDAAVAIDRGRGLVTAASGLELPYDRLLLATGSQAVMLPVPGHDLRGVTTFRDLVDVGRMIGAAATGAPAVVVGGGLLGLEAASGLARRGMAVTVVHLMDRLMERQLDATAAALLQQELEGRGIAVRLCRQTEALIGEGGAVRAVRIVPGAGAAAGTQPEELPAALVVMAVGVRPNVALARAAGLHCERGVVVDDTLQTLSDPRVWAVGECVQHRRATYGLVAPLYEQAAVCAAQLSELGHRRYAGSVTAAQLKVTGVDVHSAGDFEAKPGTEELVLRDPARGVYKRLVLKDDRLVGSVLYGDAGDGSWYLDLMSEGRSIAELRSRLLFGRAHCEAA